MGSLIARILGAASMMIGILLICSFAEQNDFTYILTGYSLAFLGYILLYREDLSTGHILALAIVVRGVAFLDFPSLSDDIYRFYWDGRLLWNGINPFSMLPADVDTDHISGIDLQLLTRLNSPKYFSIYPPISQLVYYLSSFSSIGVAVFMIRMLLVLADLIAFRYIRLMFGDVSLDKAAYLYVMNPLLIIEGVGNLHMEGMMATFILASIYYWSRSHDLKDVFKSAILMLLAIGVKLLPLMLLPYFVFRKKKGITFIVIIGIGLMILFAPFIFNTYLPNFLDSVDLYFRKFEFNASVYYMLRWVGYQLSGYNLIQYIGPILGIGVLSINIWKARASDDGLSGLLHYAFFVWTVYLMMSTTVHPWYLITPLALGIVISRHWFILWTYLVILSYSHYQYGYEENYALITMEYVLVLIGYFIFRKVDEKRSV